MDELRLQIHSDDEILIVDDHSPNDIPDFDCDCTKIIRPTKHIPHIYRLCTIRNYGLEHAKHDSCIILDPDCIPNPRFLDNARRIYDPSILYGGCIDKIQEDGSIRLDPRRKDDKSRWIDQTDRGGGGIWGGIMMFSKKRTKLVGWFDEDFNHNWGAEEHEFASRCYHSGLRLRYSMGLQITHLWHPKKDVGKETNKELWLKKVETHPTQLNIVTSYRPAVGVMVITMLRPDLIDQCLRGIYRNNVPLKTRLIVNGDDSKETQTITQQWGNRWTVDLVNHERRWPARVRNETMRWAQGKKYKYLIFIDDDVIVFPNTLVNLIRTMEQHPEIYACSGYLNNYMLGGPRKQGTFCKSYRKPGLHESDWVGGGLTIHRLNPLVPYDEDYQTGYNDYDWSMKVKQQGLNLAVIGNAGGYHGVKITSRGTEKYQNPFEYATIRYDLERHQRMKALFKKKWGLNLKEERIIT